MALKALMIQPLAVILLITSCTTMPPEEAIPIETTYYIIPPVGTIATTYIGEALLREGHASSQDAIILFQDHGTIGWTAFHPAGTYKLIGSTNGETIYQFSDLQPTGWGFVYPQIIEELDGDVTLRINTGRQNLNVNEYKKTRITQDGSEDYEQQLIYTGAQNKVLTFTYREFINDLARPSFTIDSTYDLTSGTIIRFKNASVEVVKYDNQSITYKLITGFGEN